MCRRKAATEGEISELQASGTNADSQEGNVTKEWMLKGDMTT